MAHSSTTDPNEVTQLLHHWSDGDAQALDRLLPRVYADLRAMAAQRLSQFDDHDTLQPTALVHDVVLRMLGADALQFDNRDHFFNMAGRIMRQLLMDRARTAASARHGGDMQRELLSDTIPIPDDASNHEVRALDEALTELEQLDPRVAKIVELRYFVGLSVAEAAQALRIDVRTVYRDWQMARAWLRERIAAA
ncbi:MAG: ECF-type sigma factor [Lysobacteraceae bacterium]